MPRQPPSAGRCQLRQKTWVFWEMRTEREYAYHKRASRPNSKKDFSRGLFCCFRITRADPGFFISRSERGMAALRNLDEQGLEETVEAVEPGSSTQAVHGGTKRLKPFNSLNTPIVQTATYTFTKTQELIDFMKAR